MTKGDQLPSHLSPLCERSIKCNQELKLKCWYKISLSTSHNSGSNCVCFHGRSCCGFFIIGSQFPCWLLWGLLNSLPRGGSGSILPLHWLWTHAWAAAGLACFDWGQNCSIFSLWKTQCCCWVTRKWRTIHWQFWGILGCCCCRTCPVKSIHPHVTSWIL